MSAPEWSALAFRGQIICYARVGGDWCARILGHPEPYPVTDALRAAIEVETKHQSRKLEHP